MAGVIVSGNCFAANNPMPGSWTSGPNWRGVVGVEMHCDIPEFDLCSGDRVALDCDVNQIGGDGGYLVELDDGEVLWTDILRFQRLPSSPTGISVKLAGEWIDVTNSMELNVIGRVTRFYRGTAVQ